jgi:5-formyltetrahydrofolate cyclo-ligase
MDNIKFKEELRETMIQVRNALPQSYRQLASAGIAEEFAANWGDFDCYALYSAIGSEVDAAAVAALLPGKDILYPKVRGDDLLWGKGGMAEGYGGIKEPFQTVDYLPKIVVVPCLAFDKELYRLGYGKGFYDRFLVKFPDIFSVAVAFAYQEVDTIFPEASDVKVDAVLTDKKLVL